jgi:uncharacterized protein YecE (DUF72 family)
VDDLAKIKIGTCAWSYDDWRGVFYPEHLPASARLQFHAQHFTSVEIDSTFYHAPAPHVAAHWRDVTPSGFVFSPKLSREITHDRKLRDSAGLLAGFLTAIEPLHDRLGCVLIQLPPYFALKHDEHALRDFVRHLPRDFRFAIEFRDPDWHLPRILHLLEEHRVCWAWTDTTNPEHAAEGAFEFLPRTADFLYVRLLGDLETKYRAEGTRMFHYRKRMWPRDGSLDNWSEKIRAALPDVQHAYVYLSNHFEGFAPHSAQLCAEKLGVLLPQPPPEPPSASPDAQMNLL